ncbi:MAG: cyclic nucleotide-binding domain-containing protein [Magnetococcales bacterium]|nr:cyclic nucleotide-binding domain-containing protein [Magnetococcales bacterium]
MRNLGRILIPGETIFRMGDVSDGLYVIQEGEVEIFIPLPDGGEERLTVLAKGELFGEISLFTADRRRAASARAVREARVMKLDEKMFVSRLHQDPSLGFRLMRQMAQRIQDLDREKVAQVMRERGGGWRRREESRPESSLSLASRESSGENRLPNVYDFSVAYHILMVEDDPEFFQLVRHCLIKGPEEQADTALSFPSSIAFTHAVSLTEAMERLHQEKFAVIILDLNLPDSQGVETVRRLHDAWPDTPIVVLTGEDDMELAVRAVHEGAQDYLVKGKVKQREMAIALRQAMERHRWHTCPQLEHEEHPLGSAFLPPTWRQRLGRSLCLVARRWLGTNGDET